MNRHDHEQELEASHQRAQSEDSMKNLATALNAFTGDIEDVQKGSQAHQYKYADLATVLQLARPLLHKHGLSVAQFPVSNGEQVGISTRLMHNSGEFIEESFMMTVGESRGMSAAQSIGSTLTYFRRYALAAVLGIAQIDDDAAPQVSGTPEDRGGNAWD